MTSPTQPEHLNNRHRDTLRQIFAHPVSHNVEWRAVLSLLEAVGKDIDAQMVADLRRMLSSAGYHPS